MMKKADNTLPINGILLLNKSQGMTSNTALQKVKRLYGAKKAGHTGSLDPLATGMLPICFGEATKICQYLLDADKCYETTGLLGIKTDTSDSMGEVTASVEDFSVSPEDLEKVLLQYRGTIKQIPSMFSALKHQGEPLYRYARKGIEIEREAREVVISNLVLTAFSGKTVSLTVSCSKGTYIRNLIEDIGDDLGIGAHVTHLHRLYTSGFENTPMYTLDELSEMSVTQKMDCLMPMDKAVAHLAEAILSDEDIVVIRQGRVVTNQNNLGIGEHVRLYDRNLQFVGVGESKGSGEMKAKRLLSFDSSPQIINDL